MQENLSKFSEKFSETSPIYHECSKTNDLSEKEEHPLGIFQLQIFPGKSSAEEKFTGEEQSVQKEEDKLSQ